ncbi:sulfatase-like hydrolase/transferase, partial [bacterium]|nr:sulfatase-like hydrolase/transferase [bacterium]
QFEDLGWLTAGFVDGGFLRARFGFDRGFQTYNDSGGGIARVFHRAIRWLEAKSDRPFFLFLHCYDIHAPYISPPPFRGSFHPQPYEGDFVPTTANMEQVFLRKIELSKEDMTHVMASYDEGIRYTDSRVGAFLSYLRNRGLLRNTAVIITSDHGEEFGEHGSVLHWQLYFRPNLHVPLIVRIPGATGGPVRIPDQVQLIDLLPTILDLIGAPPLEAAQGRSFLGIMSHSVSGWQRWLHRAMGSFREAPAAFAWWPDPEKRSLRSVVKGTYQLVFDQSREGRDSLFDIRADPLAQRDIAGQQPEVARSLRELGLEVMRANRPPSVARDEERSELDEETRRQLQALGYGQ